VTLANAGKGGEDPRFGSKAFGMGRDGEAYGAAVNECKPTFWFRVPSGGLGDHS